MGRTRRQWIRRGALIGSATLGIVVAQACATAGSLGSVLGSVLGQNSQQVAGTVGTVDTRNQQISIRQSNGQSLAVAYDANTKVVYQNRLYAVTNLEGGDEVVARILTTQTNSYYTDSVTVTRSVTSSGGDVSNEVVQSLQGTVRQIDYNNGLFTLDAGGGVLLTVTMPYRPTSADQNRFSSLRVGDYVRLYGVYLNNTRVELRQFYEPVRAG